MTTDLVFTGYTFDELSEEAKEKARQDHREINVYDDWSEFITDMYKEKLEEMGFRDIDISFSGFWSQGDGASFTAKSLDIEKWITYHKRRSEYRLLLRHLGKHLELSRNVYRHNYQYYHEKSTTFELDANFLDDPKPGNKLYPLIDKLEQWVKNEITTLGRAIYKDLEEDYEFKTSDKEIEERIKDLEILFHANGKQIQYRRLAKELA